jgi:site-specific recombinase XerD
MEKRHIMTLLAEKEGKPAAQCNRLRVIRMLLDYAVQEKLRRDNPAHGVKLDAPDTTGFHSWTEEESGNATAP